MFAQIHFEVVPGTFETDTCVKNKELRTIQITTVEHTAITFSSFLRNKISIVMRNLLKRGVV